MTFEPLPLYRNRHGRPLRGPALHYRIQTEADVLRPLLTHPPWVVSRNGEDDEDRAVHAAFRRWAPSDGPPSPTMQHAVHERIARDAAFRTLSEDDQDAGVARLAASLHLVALGGRGASAREIGSVGKACAGPDPTIVLISNARFARLLTAPPEPARRVEALGRAFRQFKKAGLRIAPGDAPNLLRFVFSAEPEAAVRRWAGDYFRITTPGEPAPDTDAETPDPTDAPSISA